MRPEKHEQGGEGREVTGAQSRALWVVWPGLAWCSQDPFGTHCKKQGGSRESKRSLQGSSGQRWWRPRLGEQWEDRGDKRLYTPAYTRTCLCFRN